MAKISQNPIAFPQFLFFNSVFVGKVGNLSFKWLWQSSFTKSVSALQGSPYQVVPVVYSYHL